MKKSRQKHGSTRSYWAGYYIDRFNKNGESSTEHMALWYLLLYEAFGDE